VRLAKATALSFVAESNAAERLSLHPELARSLLKKPHLSIPRTLLLRREPA
jgi:hypothetical protein